MPDDQNPHRSPPRFRRRWMRQALGADDPLPIDPELAPDDPSQPPAGHRGAGRPGATRLRPPVLGAILVGGFLGTIARYGVQVAWATPTDHFPMATFVINTSGAFLLGLLLTIVLERLPPYRYRYLRPFAGVGVLGGWTTYSTLVVEATAIGKAGDLALAGGYLALTLVCGVSAVTLGIALGRVKAPAGDRAVEAADPDEVAS